MSFVNTLSVPSDNVVRQVSADMGTHYEYRLNDGEMRKRQIITDRIGNDVQTDKLLLPEFFWNAIMVWQRDSRIQKERMLMYSNYMSMRKCYQAYFQDKDADMRFKLVFEKYAGLLAKLPIRQSYVDFSVNRKVVEFVLKLDNKLFVTIDKPLDTMEDNNVLITISRQHKLLFSDLVNICHINSTIKSFI